MFELSTMDRPTRLGIGTGEADAIEVMLEKEAGNPILWRPTVSRLCRRRQRVVGWLRHFVLTGPR